MQVPESITLLFHGNCSRGHFTLSEARKCHGKYLHFDEVKTVTFLQLELKG